MIDIHIHIIPGVDDGSQDMEQSLMMAEIASANDIHEMIVTPHCNIPGMFDNYYDERYIRNFERFESALKAEAIPLKIYPGMEVYGTYEVGEYLKKGKIITLNHSRYLLIEFGFEEDVDVVNDILDEVASQQITPIIAHPERYVFVRHDPTLVYRWIRKGYRTQINKGSITGRFGRSVYQTAMLLLDHDLVSFVATDSHNPFHRTPDMREAEEILLDFVGEEKTSELLDINPKRVILDQKLLPLDPIMPETYGYGR